MIDNSAVLQQKILSKYMLDFEEFVDSYFGDTYSELRTLFRYHIGLDDPLAKQGKHIRPLLTLLCCAGTGMDWQNAIPAAISIELIHNFSLIHDDIEDNGYQRRGKETVWVKWGLAQGLNAGDAMFTAAYRALFGLRKIVPETIALDAFLLLTETCKQLTQGQYLDIDFETRQSVSEDEYFRMVDGKTAALIACCSRMGALIGGLDQTDQEKYKEFGRALGITFQIYDDWLGIWGKSDITGKTTTGDIKDVKKTLPIILGIQKSTRFESRISMGNISEGEALEMAKWLQEDGVEELVVSTYKSWNEKTFTALEKMKCDPEIKNVLIELSNKLIIRKK